MKELKFAKPTTETEKEKGPEKPPAPAVKFAEKYEKEMNRITAQIKKEEDFKKLNKLLEKFQKVFQEAKTNYKKEEECRMELVDSLDKKIHRFELEALENIKKEINEDYEKQRKAGLLMSRTERLPLITRLGMLLFNLFSKMLTLFTRLVSYLVVLTVVLLLLCRKKTEFTIRRDTVWHT